MKLSQNEKGSFTFSMDEQPWKESEIEKEKYNNPRITILRDVSNELNRRTKDSIKEDYDTKDSVESKYLIAKRIILDAEEQQCNVSLKQFDEIEDLK